MNAAGYGRQAEYRNPYDFVPLEGVPTPAASVSLDRINGLCGVIEFALETLTPLCIHQNPGRTNQRNEYEFARLDGKPVVPATSIKGMLRAIHEIVTNSSMGLLKSEARGGWYRRRVPEGYVPIEGRLTPSETLFGIVGQGDESVGYAGRLLIEDIQVTLPPVIEQVARPRGGMPKPEHESFYFQTTGRKNVLGRKLYYHQRDYRAVMNFYETKRGRATEMRKVQVIPDHQQLTGRIRFLNLLPSELEDLIYTLILEDRLAHKLGYGKPLGLGSIRFHITRLQIETEQDGIPARFLHYGPSALHDRIAEATTLRDAALARWRMRENGGMSYAAFAAITRWPQDELFIYPDYSFFAGERGNPAKTTLQQRQQRSTVYPDADTPRPPDVAAQTAPVLDTPPETPPPVEPALPPGPPIDLRAIGSLELTSNGELIVRGRDDRRYLLTAESAARSVLRALIDRLRAGEAVRVKYRAERQRIEKQYQNIALDIEPAERGDR